MQTAAGKYTSKFKKGCINIDTMGGKKADILKDDVQAYVRELISKEFESGDNEDKAPSGNRKLNQGELWNQQNIAV